jgi:sec-independent protein translocase protein TatC
MTDKVEQEKVMSFWGHFDELRKRLFIGLIAMVITTLASFAFAQRLIFILAQPVGGTQNLLSIEVTENMGVFMRVSLLSGFVIALPVIFYEVMAFVLPGLHASEKKWVFMMIPLATLLFVIGVLFAYFVMLPTALPFLINFLGIKTTPRLSSYFSFVTGLLFWIGISFETPLVVFFLAKLKLVTAKGLARQWRVAVVVIAVLAAVITPTPDPVNMGLLMLPLFGLYLLSLLLATLAG